MNWAASSLHRPPSSTPTTTSRHRADARGATQLESYWAQNTIAQFLHCQARNLKGCGFTVMVFMTTKQVYACYSIYCSYAFVRSHAPYKEAGALT